MLKGAQDVRYGDSEYQSIYDEFLIPLEHVIFNVTDKNLDLSIQQTMELFDSNYPYSFNIVTSHLVYFSFCSHKDVNDIYLRYLEIIQTKEEEMDKNYPKIINIFYNYISRFESQEAYYLIRKMVERNLFDIQIIKNFNSHDFMSYTRDLINRTGPRLLKDQLEHHKKLVNEGVNPSEITKIIRNDDIEKLQEISSQNDFNFNQKIGRSLYERCSFINNSSVTLIDYAAFFGSVKCFKFLLMNEANIKNTFKYAVAGGNEEIIHLCEQNHSSFKDAYETAIEFHRNDIFHYLYEKRN